MARWPANAAVHTGTAPRSGARRRNANREEAAAWNADLRHARRPRTAERERGDGLERRPPVGTRGSAKPHVAEREEARGRLGTPTSGRHARERETSADDAALGQLEFRTPFQSRMAQRCTPRICAVTLGPVCAMGDSSTAPFARLGRAVPAGGRRSKPSPRFCSGGDMRFRCAIAQRCRPEAGVPPPAARRRSCRSPPRGRRDRPGLFRAALHRLRRTQTRQGRELRDVERTKSWPVLWRPIRIPGAARVPSVAPGGGQSIRR